MHTDRRGLFWGMAAAALALPLMTTPAKAADVIDVKTIGSDLAHDLVSAAVKACSEKGYSISAVVVDRGGDTVSVLRSENAAKYTISVATGKARAAIMTGTSVAEFRASRPDLSRDLNQLDGMIFRAGALPVDIGGRRVGAMGVSGAPGGDIDESCVQAALDKYADRIDFAQ